MDAAEERQAVGAGFTDGCGDCEGKGSGIKISKAMTTNHDPYVNFFSKRLVSTKII